MPALRDALIGALNVLPIQLRRSLTWDQGTEMAKHVEITEATGITSFFCHPHSPWQRRSNENMNRLLECSPQGTDLNIHSARYLLDVATGLNERPRKTLGCRMPADLLSELLSKTGRVPLAPTA